MPSQLNTSSSAKSTTSEAAVRRAAKTKIRQIRKVKTDRDAAIVQAYGAERAWKLSEFKNRRLTGGASDKRAYEDLMRSLKIDPAELQALNKRYAVKTKPLPKALRVESQIKSTSGAGGSGGGGTGRRRRGSVKPVLGSRRESLITFGDAEVYETRPEHQFGDNQLRPIHNHFVVENRGAGDFDPHFLQTERQVGQSVAARPGEKLSIEVKFNCEESRFKVSGKDETGWSELSLRVSTYYILDVGEERQMIRMWTYEQYDDPERLREDLVPINSWTQLVHFDVESVPAIAGRASNAYVSIPVWFGILDYFLVLQNDYSLTVEFKNNWIVEELKATRYG